MTDYPNIDFNGKELFEVACKKCQKGGKWKIYTDRITLVAKCDCGHMVEIKKEKMRRRPEMKPIPISMVA